MTKAEKLYKECSELHEHFCEHENFTDYDTALRAVKLIEEFRRILSSMVSEA